MNIRAIRDEDIKAVVALWKATGLVGDWPYPERDIAFSRQCENSTILVAEKDGVQTGTVMVGHDGHWGWVYYFGVAEQYRENGVGRQLMNAAEAWLRDRGIKKVNLLVRKDNREAQRFYARMGFTEYDPCLTMQKIL